MSDRALILERLQRKETEIQSLEDRLRTARIYAQALRDVVNALGRDSQAAPSDGSLRAGSSVALVRELILNTGKPVHITDLLEGLGKGVTKEGRASLASSLAAYVRRGEIFTRPAPNTFGLVELGHSQEAASHPEPPPEFGTLRGEKHDDGVTF